MDMKKITGMSDETVKAKTGKSWPGWLAVLDKAGAKQWRHPEIARYLHENCGVPGWWSQMVTVGYERARGMREKHQTTAGFVANTSKTVSVPLGKLYGAWKDIATRKRWLPHPKFTVRKATRNRCIRMVWVDGKTTAEAMFLTKGRGKSLVAVQHNKLANAKEVAAKKKYWGAALGKLQQILEK
jgi:hypothetical protein